MGPFGQNVGERLGTWMFEHPEDSRAEIDAIVDAGGPTTTNAFLALGLIDELRLHVVPITLGGGIRVFDGVPDLQLTPTSSRTTPHVTHVTWRVGG